eukprot:139691_1
MQDESPEEDMEIIDSTDIPTDPNANTNIQPDNEASNEPIDTNILESPKSVLQSAPDLSALTDIQQQQQQENDNQFVAIHDPNNVTQPTDTTLHNKTQSEAAGFDMFSFFKVENNDSNDSDNDDDEDNDNDMKDNNNKPNARGQSMGGIQNLKY